MGVFFVLLLAPIIFQHFIIKNHSINVEKRNNKILFLFFAWLAILLMFRHECIGNDTRNYIYYFERFSQMGWAEVGSNSMEYGFSYFNKLVSLISDNSQFFLAVTAIMTICMIYPTYKRLCLDPSLTIVLFCTMATFVMMFSGIRQMLAIGMGVLSYEFVRVKKLIPFIVMVLLAMLFHESAFMLAIMYPLYHIRITKKWLCVVIPVLGLIFVFNKPIFLFLVSVLGRYTDYNTEIQYTGAYTMLILFGLFAIISFFVPDELKLDAETIGLRNFLLFSVALQMFAPLHTISMRMNYYYIIFIPLLLPKIFSCRRKKMEQVAILSRHVMVGFFSVYFFISAYRNGNLQVFPYHFFWETVL